MAKVQLIGNTLIAEINGNVYSNTSLSKDDQFAVLMMIANFPEPENDEQSVEQETQIKTAMKCIENEEYKKTAKKKEEVVDYQNLVNTLSGIDETLFVFENNILTYKGIPLSIPKVLAERISAANTEEREALINFWYRCAKNENPRSRQDLFEFIEKYKFQVLKSGLFVAYRNVHMLQEYAPLFTFTNDLVNQIKIWRRSLTYYTIVKYSLKGKEQYKWVENSKPNYEGRLKKAITALEAEGATDCRDIGNCKDVWENLVYKQDIFTDNHSKTFKISLNKVIEMDRKSCDKDPRKDCSYGLHVGTPSFLSAGSFGNVCMAVLVDPEDVVAVPEYHTSKMRICKYYPVAFTSYNDRGKLIELNLKEDEINYCTIKIEDVKQYIDNKKHFEEYQQNNLVPQELTFEVYKNMNSYLSGINKIVKSRTKKMK